MAAIRVFAFAALAFGFISMKPELFPPRDFIEYWSAANVLANGGNPYDGMQVLEVQRIAKGEPEAKEAVSLWTPPWTLPLYLPFGFLSFAFAHKVWLIVQLICLGASVELLCETLRCASRLNNYLALVLFSPVFWDLHFGQNAAFILLGLAGFLRFRESRPFIAGAFVSLTAIKPHLLAIFGTVLILDAVRPSGRRVLFSGIGMLVLGSLFALVIDARIFDQFAEAVQKESTPETVSLRDWNVPVFSYHLRMAVASNTFEVQFIPCLATCILGCVYYYARRSMWHWLVELPRLIVVSILVAPYGAWIFDLTLLLIPLIVGAVLILRSEALVPKLLYFAGLLIVSGFGLLIGGLHHAWWFAPAFTGLYIFAEYCGRKDAPCRVPIAS